MREPSSRLDEGRPREDGYTVIIPKSITIVHERLYNVGGSTPLSVQDYNGIQVVRDDLMPGGTKARVIHKLFDDLHTEYVYASPVQGYAQVALAFAAKEHGKLATIFCAERSQKHRLTLLAESAGARMRYVGPPAFLKVCQSRAAKYAEETGAKLLPFGLHDPVFIDALADIARVIQPAPKEVWSVAASGTLTAALQLAWPDAVVHAVRIGAIRDVGRAHIWTAPEKFEQDAKFNAPFPSCANYDRKAWRFILEHATPGALFWNVAG